MGNVVLCLAVSLDGYIADSQGSVSWLTGDGSNPEALGSFPQFYEELEIVLMGYNTYEQIINELSPDQWPYEDKKTYVFTHKKITNQKNIIFTAKQPKELLPKIKEEATKTIWICGGSNLANQMMRDNLIDYYYITVVPTILGNGVKLFDEHSNSIRLKLVFTTHYNGFVDLVYEKT